MECGWSPLPTLATFFCCCCLSHFLSICSPSFFYIIKEFLFYFSIPKNFSVFHLFCKVKKTNCTIKVWSIKKESEWVEKFSWVSVPSTDIYFIFIKKKQISCTNCDLKIYWYLRCCSAVTSWNQFKNITN